MENVRVLVSESKYKDYLVFDDLEEYLEKVCEVLERDSFARFYKFPFKEVFCNGGICYEDPEYDNMVLTEDVYNMLQEISVKKYRVDERDLLRTVSGSNCFTTGNQNSIEDVMEFLYDKDRSWLYRIADEIDNEIEELERKLRVLKENKERLFDFRYLKSKVVVEGRVVYKKTKEEN